MCTVWPIWQQWQQQDAAWRYSSCRHQPCQPVAGTADTPGLQVQVSTVGLRCNACNLSGNTNRMIMLLCNDLSNVLLLPSALIDSAHT